jgi:PAS domain-containing protein
MSVAVKGYPVHIPLEGLPLAAACLDSNGVILASNPRFRRLVGSAELGHELRLADVVRENNRPAVQQAIEELTIFQERAPVTCRLRVEHRQAPFLPLSITLSELGPEASVRFLACVEAIPRRRRTDRDSVPATRTASPFLSATISNELRWPLAAIRGWAALAEAGAIEVYALTDAEESAPTFIVRLPMPARRKRLRTTATIRDAVFDAAIVVTGTA